MRPSLGAVLRAGLAGGASAKALTPVSDRGWFSVIRESFPGAWQRNVEVNVGDVLTHHAAFACMTLIASDIAKLRPKLVQWSKDDQVWSEIDSPAFSPVLRKPNLWQNRIQFFESWVLSKLSTGNAVILKGRDARDVVTSLQVLNWKLVRPLVADDGEVFYELDADNVAGIGERVVVAAREIIHDRFNCLYHPLIGMTPIAANGLAATQGLSIQRNSARFFAAGSTAPGILTAPGAISPETAARIKAHWEENYTGDNSRKVAVLGDGLKFETMSMSAVDSQLIDQLKWSAEVVCSTFHVPPYKIGIGEMPKYDNIQALNVEYYSQALQILIEAMELCLDEGLGLASREPQQLGVEFDLDGLLRMDSVTQMRVLGEGVQRAIYAPNEARRKLDLKPVEGGEEPLSQQQNYSLAALAERDRHKPLLSPGPNPTEAPPPPAEEPANDDGARTEAEAAKALLALHKGLAHV